MSDKSVDVKKRADVAFNKLEQRNREAERRVVEQRQSDAARDAKTKRLREMRLAQEASETAAKAAELAERPVPVKRPRAAPRAKALV